MRDTYLPAPHRLSIIKSTDDQSGLGTSSGFSSRLNELTWKEEFLHFPWGKKGQYRRRFRPADSGAGACDGGFHRRGFVFGKDA